MLNYRCYAKVLAKVSIVLAGIMSAIPVWALDFSDISARAKKLSQENYVPPELISSKPLQELKFGDYQKIFPNLENALWAQDQLSYRVSFFHPGMHFLAPVKINEVDQNGIRPVVFKQDYFNFSEHPDLQAKLNNEKLAFNGFRIHYPLNRPDHLYDELASFLGASYFRMIGAGQVYGLSARGLAIDTALPSGEVFPSFKEFWLLRPARGDKHIILFALLDSPNVTGAYRFTVTPGDTTITEVRATLYFRDSVGKLGIAPASSMFLYGSNQAPVGREYRPELHDTDGLAIVSGNGEQLWRPLNNPRRLALSVFQIENPKAFGLLQRGREFSRYEDLEDRYEARPSMWIEPRGDWGKGSVELLELPTADETNDNIAMMWVPQQSPKKGDALDIAYNIYWTRDDAKFTSKNLAYVSKTIRSVGETRGSDLIRRQNDEIALLVDFTAPLPEKTKAGTQAVNQELKLSADISSNDNVQVLSHTIVPNPGRQGYRLTLNIQLKDKEKVGELRAQLFNQDKPWSEVWTYQVTNNESK